MTDRFNADNAHPSQYCYGITDAVTSRTHLLICQQTSSCSIMPCSANRKEFATLKATKLRHTALRQWQFRQQSTA
eukprot:3578501-Pleurochrysis_carterae.AAC.1